MTVMFSGAKISRRPSYKAIDRPGDTSDQEFEPDCNITLMQDNSVHKERKIYDCQLMHCQKAEQLPLHDSGPCNVTSHQILSSATCIAKHTVQKPIRSCHEENFCNVCLCIALKDAAI